MGMGKGERSENEDGMAMGKEEMEKPGQDTWREGQNNGKRKRNKSKHGHNTWIEAGKIIKPKKRQKPKLFDEYEKF